MGNRLGFFERKSLSLPVFPSSSPPFEERAARLVRSMQGRVPFAGALANWAIRRSHKKRRGSPDPVLIRDFDGDLTILVRPGYSIGAELFWKGFYERPVLRALEWSVKPHSFVIDAGANVGAMTLFAAKRAREGRVWAFEPQKEAFGDLEENIRLNSFTHVRLFDLALGEKEGEVELFTFRPGSQEIPYNEGLSTLYPHGLKRTPLGKARMRRLDDVLEEEGAWGVDVLKMDVEGAELSLLKGASKTLERDVPTLVLEHNVETWKAAGYSPRDIYGFLEGFSYEFTYVDPEGRPRKVHWENLPPWGTILARGARREPS